MDPERAREILRRLMTGRRFGVLATASPEGPYGSLVAFAAAQDLSSVVFASPRDTRKYANLAVCAAAALVVADPPGGSGENPAAAATAVGRAVELDGAARDEAVREYARLHPRFAGFAGDRSAAFFRLAVSRYTVAAGVRDVLVVDVPL